MYHKPFVTWIWGGCVLMALGGALALSDRRYRLQARRSPALPYPGEVIAMNDATDSALEVSPNQPPPNTEPKSALAFCAATGDLRRFLRCFLFVGLGLNPREVPSPLIGKPAPAFQLPQLAQPERDIFAAADEGRSVVTQRLGVVVRRVPHRASAAG